MNEEEVTWNVVRSCQVAWERNGDRRLLVKSCKLLSGCWTGIDGKDRDR